MTLFTSCVNKLAHSLGGKMNDFAENGHCSGSEPGIKGLAVFSRHRRFSGTAESVPIEEINAHFDGFVGLKHISHRAQKVNTSVTRRVITINSLKNWFITYKIGLKMNVF